MTAKAPRAADYLGHVLEAIGRVEQYIDGLSYEDFAARSIVQDAVIRNLEIIGEACRNIELREPDFAVARPDLPLRSAAEMRNALAHGYFAVDLAIVWRTVQRDLPGLRDQVRAILADLG